MNRRLYIVEVSVPGPRRYAIVADGDHDADDVARGAFAIDPSVHTRVMEIREPGDLRANEQDWVPEPSAAAINEDPSLEHDRRKAWEWASEMAGRTSAPE